MQFLWEVERRGLELVFQPFVSSKVPNVCGTISGLLGPHS